MPAVDQSQPRLRNKQGLAALEAGDAGEAIGHFTAAVEAHPTATALWMNLAKAKM